MIETNELGQSLPLKRKVGRPRKSNLSDEDLSSRALKQMDKGAKPFNSDNIIKQKIETVCSDVCSTEILQTKLCVINNTNGDILTQGKIVLPPSESEAKVKGKRGRKPGLKNRNLSNDQDNMGPTLTEDEGLDYPSVLPNSSKLLEEAQAATENNDEKISRTHQLFSSLSNKDNILTPEKVDPPFGSGVKVKGKRGRKPGSKNRNLLGDPDSNLLLGRNSRAPDEDIPKSPSSLTLSKLTREKRKSSTAPVKGYEEISEDGSNHDDILTPEKIDPPLEPVIKVKGKRGRKPGSKNLNLPIDQDSNQLLQTTPKREDEDIICSPFSATVSLLLKSRAKLLNKVDCPICSHFSCSNYGDIIQHMEACKHDLIKCNLCGDEFKDIDSKVDHLINEHNGIEYLIDPKEIEIYRTFVSRALATYKSFHCFRRECPKSYTTIPGLMYHLKLCYSPDGGTQREDLNPSLSTTTGSRASKIKAKKFLSSYSDDDGTESRREIKQERRDVDFKFDFDDECNDEDLTTKETLTPSHKVYKVRKRLRSQFSGRMPFSPSALPDWKPDITKWKPTKLDPSLTGVRSPRFHVVDKGTDFFDISKNEVDLRQPFEPKTISFGQGISSQDGHSLTCFAGAAITAISWAPYLPEPLIQSTPGGDLRQYFCLCTRLVPPVGTIQIWSMVDPFARHSEENYATDSKPNLSCPKFEYGIVHDFGTIYDCNFCPTYPSAGTSEHQPADFLGLLAVTSETGRVIIAPLPLPHQLPHNGEREKAEVLGMSELVDWEDRWFETDDLYYLSLYPPLKIPKDGDVDENHNVARVSKVFPQCLDWHLDQHYCKLAAGFSDGTIGIWNLTACSKPESPCFNTVAKDPRSKPLSQMSVLLPSQDLGNVPDPLTVPLMRPTRVLGPGIAHLREITGLSWCPFDGSGRYLAAVGRDKSYAVWDLQRPNDYGCNSVQPLPQAHSKTSNHFTGCVWAHDTTNILAIGDTHASTQSFHLFDNGFAVKERLKLAALHHSCHLAVSYDPYDSNFAISTAGGLLVTYHENLGQHQFYSKSQAFRQIPIYQTTSSVPPHDDGATKMESESSIGGEIQDVVKIRLHDDQLFHEELNGTNDKTLPNGRSNRPYLLFNDIFQNVPNAKDISVADKFQEKLKTTCFENPHYKDQLWIYKVAWNPFASSHNWLLSSTGAGFVRLNYLPYLAQTVEFYEKGARKKAHRRKS